MAEHEPLDIASKDNDQADKSEARAARLEADRPQGLQPQAKANSANIPSDDAQVASEPMELQRLPYDGPIPPGRQRTGDPPAPSRNTAAKPS